MKPRASKNGTKATVTSTDAPKVVKGRVGGAGHGPRQKRENAEHGQPEGRLAELLVAADVVVVLIGQHRHEVRRGQHVQQPDGVTDLHEPPPHQHRAHQQGRADQREQRQVHGVDVGPLNPQPRHAGQYPERRDQQEGRAAQIVPAVGQKRRVLTVILWGTASEWRGPARTVTHDGNLGKPADFRTHSGQNPNG
jgi:hypothetical protein